MSTGVTALDHPDPKPSRLRANRLRITQWIAAIEGVLVLVGAIPHLVVYLLAIVATGFYVAVGRNYTSPTARSLTWIFAGSQLLTVLVPIILFFAKTIAIIAIVGLAVVGLLILFTDRGKT